MYFFLYEYIVTNVLVWAKESSLTYIPWIIDLTHMTFNSSQIKNEILLMLCNNILSVIIHLYTNCIHVLDFV